MAIANVEVAGARYRLVTFSSLTSLEEMTMCDSSVNEKPISIMVSQTVATTSSSCAFRMIRILTVFFLAMGACTKLAGGGVEKSPTHLHSQVSLNPRGQTRGN